MYAHWNPQRTVAWQGDTTLVVNPGHLDAVTLTLSPQQTNLVDRLRGGMPVQTLSTERSNPLDRLLTELCAHGVIHLSDSETDPFEPAADPDLHLRVSLHGACHVGKHLAHLLADASTGMIRVIDPRPVSFADIGPVGYPLRFLDEPREGALSALLGPRCSPPLAPARDAARRLAVIVERGAIDPRLVSTLRRTHDDLLTVAYDHRSAHVGVFRGHEHACYRCWQLHYEDAHPGFSRCSRDLPYLAHDAPASFAALLASAAAHLYLDRPDLQAAVHYLDQSLPALGASEQVTRHARCECSAGDA
ncbi:hypothetical protein JT358_12745 [Micrococcales bacterium 31B]|nr:hypothetical protein [Micrococcales bacterium 31B]